MFDHANSECLVENIERMTMEGYYFGLNSSRPLWVRTNRNVIIHARCQPHHQPSNTILKQTDFQKAGRGGGWDLKRETLSSQSEGSSYLGCSVRWTAKLKQPIHSSSLISASESRLPAQHREDLLSLYK